MGLAQPDRGVLERARKGDERAFAEVVQAYQTPVLGYIRRMIGDPVLAEDLAQEVFLRVYRRLGSFRGQCLFTTWLFQIAKNRVLDELRAQARHPIPPLELADEIASYQHAPERDGEIDETVAAIWRAVSELDVDLKAALLLRDVVGLSYREIGETLEIELATVKWRIYSAREAIQTDLAIRNLSPEFPRMAPAHTAVEHALPAAVPAA